MTSINYLFNDNTAERVNEFFSVPKIRLKLLDEDVISVIFTCRAINNLAAFEEVCSWATTHRPELINKISRGLVIADLSLRGSGIGLAFQLRKMNNAERAFTLLSALDGKNTEVFNVIIDTVGSDDQLSIFEFLVRMFHFKFKNHLLLKVNGTSLQSFINDMKFVHEQMTKRKFESSLLLKTMAAALANINDFQSARVCLKGIRGTDALYSRTQIDFREACAKGNLKAAQNFVISLIEIVIATPSIRRGFDEIGKFDPNACLISLRRTYELLNTNGLDPFLISGTLLGMVRDGKIFDHDKDFDIAVIGWEKQFDVFEILYKSGEYDLDVRKLRGDKTSLLSVRHKPTGIVCDIFFMRAEGEAILHNVDLELGFTIPFIFSQFEFEEKRFGDDCFRVPAQWERNLSENYGVGWRSPDPGYDVLIESPGIRDKLSDEYKTLALDRILNSVVRADVRGLNRKINYLGQLGFDEADIFHKFVKKLSSEDIVF